LLPGRSHVILGPGIEVLEVLLEGLEVVPGSRGVDGRAKLLEESAFLGRQRPLEHGQVDGRARPPDGVDPGLELPRGEAAAEEIAAGGGDRDGREDSE